MAQKISQMTEQTTSSMTEAGTSDFLGGYTATGGNANRKFSLSGLANYFLNKFKMTLGGSSQTVKSAIDALNSNSYLLKGGTRLISSQSNPIDANDLVPGSYYIVNNNEANYISNIPFKRCGRITVYSTDGVDPVSYLRQEYIAYDGDPYVRVKAGSTWSDWAKQPTRAEMTPTEITDFVTIDTSKVTLVDSSNCYKVGNVVFIAIDFTALTSESSPRIGTLVSSIRPPKTFFSGCFDYTNRSKSKGVKISKDGSIFVYAPENGHEYFLSCTYITT